MSKETQTINYNSIGVLQLLTIVFVVLKLCNVITWSWWLVLLPTLLSISFGILIFIVFILVIVFSLKKGYKK